MPVLLERTRAEKPSHGGGSCVSTLLFEVATEPWPWKPWHCQQPYLVKAALPRAASPAACAGPATAAPAVSAASTISICFMALLLRALARLRPDVDQRGLARFYGRHCLLDR